MPIVTVGKPLRDKLGDEAVDAMIELINNSQAQHKNEILEFVEEKFERRLVEEVGKLEVKISKVEHKISETRADLITSISETRADLIARISETRADLITRVSETKAD
ncbi:MAG: LA_3696 family protein, partial [bacterium]